MNLRDIVEAMAGKRILVIGDPIIDVYHFGRVDRLSPEAPVPIFVEERVEFRKGGAANVKINLESLGVEVRAFFPPPLVEKHRYIVGHQQLFRVDKDEGYEPLSVDGADLSIYDAIIVSDYAKGAVGENTCRSLSENKLIVVDPKGRDWSKYDGATWICPNEKELNEARRIPECRILEKVGSRGLFIDEELIAATAKQVFDVTGAGDTVVATFTAALCAGASHKDAAILANYAAGVVVGKLGTSVCTKEELLNACGSL